MTIPIPILFVACLTFVPHMLRAQTTAKACRDIRVEANVQKEPGHENSQTISLKFVKPLDYQDFQLFLFAPKRAQNNISFTASEIKNLSKGKYTLVVQHKKDDRYCSKLFNLTLQ